MQQGAAMVVGLWVTARMNAVRKLRTRSAMKYASTIPSKTDQLEPKGTSISKHTRYGTCAAGTQARLVRLLPMATRSWQGRGGEAAGKSNQRGEEGAQRMRRR